MMYSAAATAATAATAAAAVAVLPGCVEWYTFVLSFQSIHSVL
jgi:hypothetical protein